MNKPERQDNEKQEGGKNNSDEIENNFAPASHSRSDLVPNANVRRPQITEIKIFNYVQFIYKPNVDHPSLLVSFSAALDKNSDKQQ